ncbi:hypothetical protein CRENBAI_025392, partial [Crenichthys baileyi]
VVVCPFISNLSLEVFEDIEHLKLAVEAESNQSCENPKDCIGTEKDCRHELLFDIPRGVTSDQRCLVSFIFSAESDGTVSGGGNEKVVRIYAEGQVHSTNKDIIFLVVTDIPDPVEFFWDFGDSKLAKTSLRTITKRYHIPGSYQVVVVASRGQMSVTSDVFPIVVQRAVKLSRLVHQASVLRNRTLTIRCRVNVGTNLTFMWSFGDETTRPGLSTTHHIFHRLGEFIIKVTASNLISSASLSSHIFVVDRPCQPPPVKNMGPLKLQFQRHEAIHLGVTFETDVDCDISEGLHYTWTLFGSGSQIIPLPHTDTQRQSLILESHLLQYDTYTAIARVEVIGSVVYSNYTVTFQVKPSPPVAFIQGGTNFFIGKKSSNMVTLDGQKSYDPDFPENLLSYSWTCKPVSTITSSCFDQDIPTSSPVLKFPTSLLKPRFDQFQFTLTVRSGERSGSSEAFLTCQGDRVNWDQSFTVSAVCEDCNIRSELIHYAWSLYLVNASSKPIIEVPFCYTVDVSAPFAILEHPTTSTLTPEMFSLHPSVTDVSQDHHNADASSPAFLTEKISEATLQPLVLYLGDRKTASAESRDKSDQSDMLRSDPSHTPVLDQDTRLLSDHMSFSSVSSEFPTESSADWKHAFPLMEGDHVAGQPANSVTSSEDYDVPYPSMDEGDPGMSAGRLSDADSISPGDDSVTLNNEGSNLMDSKPSAVILEPTLLDLHRDSVERGQFESYTYTGISSTSIQFKPFSLEPRSLYMLQVTAKFNNDLIGRTQLFLKSNPVPEGMTCQVQPAEGMELHTPFSIFCTSGREDLEYKYSFSVGGRPPRILYQGRDIQYYFSLPSGDPSDDYKIRIYTEIRSSSSGSATKRCPVTVRVRPSFLRNTSSSSSSHHDPALMLSKSLRNLSRLVQLGNLVEIRNYISLLTSILNRLSRDADANTHAQIHTRNVLICTLCKFKGSDEVTITSVRCVASHVRSVSEKLPEFSANQDMLYSLINSLSYCLQVVTSCSCTPETTGNFNNTHVLGPGSLTAQNTKDSEHPSTGPHLEHGGEVPTKRVMQLVEEILQSAAELMLRHILLHEAKVHRVRTGLITLLASSQNRTSTIIRSGFTTIYLPAALIQSVFGFHTGRSRLRQQQPCIFRVLTELSHNYYPREKCPPQLQTARAFTGPVESSTTQYILQRNQVNYHNFSISQQLLQHAIQVTVVLTSPSSKPFPIMLLFRMFERPTPSMHHLQRIHQWEHNVIRVTLPPSYLNAAGVAHIALLDADFERLPRSKIQREQISYSLTADSSLCASWDGQQGDWTHHDCRTHQTDTSSAATCSCFQLRPLTVFQQQIQSSQDTGDLDPFLSESSNLTVVIILAILLLLYILGLIWSERADSVSKENQRVHYVSDNSPADPFLYAVCIHTGLCSATHMTAKVYIVLYGENGFSQTKELQVPGCTLFRRNTKDTFIVSAADSLGPVWGVHIWHDNSGPSPDWYLKQVVVSEGKIVITHLKEKLKNVHLRWFGLKLKQLEEIHPFETSSDHPRFAALGSAEGSVPASHTPARAPKRMRKKSWKEKGEAPNLKKTQGWVLRFFHHSPCLEVFEFLQKKHRGHVDVSAVANWEQKIRTLWGVIFFLLTMKCVAVLKVSRTLSFSAAVLSQTLSSLLWPVVSGLILLLALSCSSNLLHAESSWAFSSFPRSLQTLLCHYRGPRVPTSPLHAGQGFSHWAVLFLTTTAVWMTVITGAISLLVKTAKISQSRNFNFTTGELSCYLRMKVSEFTGRQRQARTDDNDKRRTNVLEELESSVDELLFRLSVLSSSMHHSLRAHCHREEASPVISALPQSPNMDTQEHLSSRIMVKNPKTGNKSTHEPHEGATPPASRLLGSQVEIQNVLDGKNEMLDTKTWLPTSESTSLERLWAEDICENQPEMQTRSNGRRWFTKTHSKVVEVLVHYEPGTGEP